MTSSLVLRRIVTVNGREQGANVLLSVAAVKARGEQVVYLAAHPRSGFPLSPDNYNEHRRHARHVAKVERMSAQ